MFFSNSLSFPFSVNCSPQNKEELFNLCHASARNVIERLFGIVKNRFRILNCAPGFDMDLQCRIPVALAAIHNFIIHYDPHDASDLEEMESEDLQPGLHVSLLADGPAQCAEKDQADA